MYGGTKQEMQRLIADANEYAASIGEASDLSIESFSDIITAIQLIQEKQNIAGTTSKEAAKTIEGSFNALKASWENLVSGFANGNADISKLTKTVAKNAVTAYKNILPAAKQALTGIGQAIEEVAPIVSKKLPAVMGQVIPAATTAIGNLLHGVGAALPGLIVSLAPVVVNSARQIITDAANAVVSFAKSAQPLLSAGLTFVDKIASGISNNLPKLIDIAANAALKFSDGLRKNAGKLVDAGIKLIMSLADGLIKSLPTLIKTVPTIVSNIAGIINDNAPKLIKAGIQLIVMLAKGIIQALPTIKKEFPKIIKAIIDVWTAVNWLALGKTLVTGIINGVRNLAPKIPQALKELATKAINAFRSVNWVAAGRTAITTIINGLRAAGSAIANALRTLGTSGINAFRSVNWVSVGKAVISLIAKALKGAGNLIFTALKAVGRSAMNAFRSINWKSLGINVVKGIAAGISGGVSNVVNAAKNVAKSALDGAKNFLGIHSPSKVAEKEIGLQYVLGIANGIKKNKEYAKKSAQEIGEAIVQASEQRMNNLKVYHTVSLDQEKKYWDNVRKQVAKGTQARIDADAKYYELSEQLQAEKQQSRLNKLVEEYNKTLTAAKNVAAKLKKILKDDGDSLLSSAEKWLTNQQVYHKTSLQYEVEYWDSVRKQLKKGTQARIDADAKYKESLASLKEAQKSAKQEAATLTKEYVKSYKRAAKEVITQKRALKEQLKEDLQKIDDELDSQIKELDKQYEDAVKNRAATIKGFFGVLDTGEVKEDEDVDLLSNVMNQVDALEQWDETLTQLERKLGSGSSLYEELSGMGVDNLSTLKRFNKMSNAELQTYVAFYEKKNQIAERRAKAEHESLKADLEKQTNELKENARKQSEELRQEYKVNAAKIEQDAADQMKSLTDQYSSDISKLAKTAGEQGESVGEQMIQGIKNGIEATKSILTDASQSAVNDALNAAQQKLGISGTASTASATRKLGMTTATSSVLPAMNFGSINTSILGKKNVEGTGTATSKSTTNNVAINVYGAKGQNERELADIISNRLNQTVQRRGTVFA